MKIKARDVRAPLPLESTIDLGGQTAEIHFLTVGVGGPRSQSLNDEWWWHPGESSPAVLQIVHSTMSLHGERWGTVGAQQERDGSRILFLYEC